MLARQETGARDRRVAAGVCQVEDKLDPGVGEERLERVVRRDFVERGEAPGSIRIAVVDSGELEIGVKWQRMHVKAGHVAATDDGNTHPDECGPSRTPVSTKSRRPGDETSAAMWHVYYSYSDPEESVCEAESAANGRGWVWPERGSRAASWRGVAGAGFSSPRRPLPRWKWNRARGNRYEPPQMRVLGIDPGTRHLGWGRRRARRDAARARGARGDRHRHGAGARAAAHRDRRRAHDRDRALAALAHLPGRRERHQDPPA
jgi:hypothetical protein